MRALRPLVVVVALAVVLPLTVLAAPAAASASAASPVGGGPSHAGAAVGTQEAPCTGTVTEPADGWTVVSVQGAKGGEKKAARLVAFGPEGRVKFVHPYRNAVWGYDVDPMPNGNLFVTTTIRRGGDGDTRVFALDPETGERAWQETFDALDTHDADLVRRNSIAVANMRNYDEEAGENRDRLFVYNRTTDAVTTEWQFDDHYDPSVGGNYEDDWTHVNDVEWLGGDRYMLSPRNFDQVVVVNASSGEILQRLGADGNFDVLRKQHNPDYLAGENGTPTMLVGDSENDRVVEYANVGGDWRRTWSVGEGQFDWPRDADRLPDGNTLITDSRNHRVLEVTPEGEVVWEVYVPWLPYDAERIGTGDESSGPTTREQGATGAVALAGSAGVHEDEAALAACGAHLDGFGKTSADDWPAGDVAAGNGTTATWTGGDDTGGGSDGTGDGGDAATDPDALPADAGALVAGGVVAVVVAVALGVRARLRD